MQSYLFLGGALFLGFLSGCVSTKKLVKPPPQESVLSSPLIDTPLVVVPPESWPPLIDDSDPASLKTSAENSLVYFKSVHPTASYKLGKDTYTARDFVETLETFLELLPMFSSGTSSTELLRSQFMLYQSTGTTVDRHVTFSSYYEHTLPARLAKTKEYRFPLYARPPDLIDVDLSQFDTAWQGARIAGRKSGRNLVPYYSREEIDSNGKLKGQNLEIAWAKDPMEILFLQIEGSGWLDLGDGQRLRVRFDGTNGLKFRSVGQNLINTGKIPKSEFSRERFEKYMREHPQERQSLLNVNRRYVFFRVDRGDRQEFAFGNIGVALTPWRSIATDPRLFPKGALAWISVEGKTQRFVLNQDEGGAILGPGRVDYFVGGGKEAERYAWSFWNPGRLYFLVKKRSALQKS